MQESSRIIEENSLETKLVTVHKTHAGDDDGKQKSQDCNHNLPTIMIIKETILIDKLPRAGSEG